MELHQNVEKFLHLSEKVVENSRLAPQFLPSPRPNLPAITDSPEGGANLLVGGPIYWSLRYRRPLNHKISTSKLAKNQAWVHFGVI